MYVSLVIILLGGRSVHCYFVEKKALAASIQWMILDEIVYSWNSGHPL